MYPVGVRCQSLCVDVVEVGFVKEEVGQGVVVVEETLAEYIHSRGENYVSGSAYNVSACSKDKLLSSCSKTLSTMCAT